MRVTKYDPFYLYLAPIFATHNAALTLERHRGL
jgi:hypothetical protein